MKPKIISILLFLPMVLTTLAQAPDRAVKQRPGIEQWAEELKLTAEQRALIDDLNKKHLEQIKPLLTDREGNAEKLKAFHREHRKEIKAVLTPEQQTRVKELRAEHMDKMKQMRSELRTYRESNIEPVLRQKRLDFDKELSFEERKTIEAMRNKVREVVEGRKGERKIHNKVYRHRRHLKNRDMHQELKVSLDPIVAAHKTSLDSIKHSLQSDREKWKADMKAIRAKYKNPQDRDSDENISRRQRLGKYDGKEASHKNESMRFLLMPASSEK